MAETKGGNTVGGLYMRLGLSLDGLQSGFIAAEKTVQQNIARLNRESNLVKIRADIEMTGLDAVKDKTRLLEVQEQSLTRQLELQRDKLALVSAAYQEAAKNKNTAATQKLETSMERERLAVARLEAELKKLSTQRISFDTAGLQDSIAKLNSRIKNIRIQAEIDTSKLQNAGSIFDAQKVHISAVTRELELQRQKYAQLQVQIMDAAKNFGGDSSVTLNIKTNALQQYQEIQRLETKLKELQGTDINLKIRADAIKQAEQTIHENIARINAKIDLIRVKTEVDTSKLSGATAEFDKAKAHVNALNQELTLQNQKLVEMQRLLSQSSGIKAINIAADIQRQIQAIDQLKAKIQELSNIQPPKSGLLSEYLNIKGDITGQLNNIATAFSNLRGATSSADNAIVSVLGVIDSIPSPVGKAVTALAGLPVVFAGIENSIVDMMKATAAAGDATYVMSRGFQMSVADTGKFTTMCKTAGVEVNDLASTLKRVQQSIVRGGEDAKAEQWLKRYGESAFDANGKLKDLNEMTLTLSRALKSAQADGRGMEFILATMRNASADAITAIEDAEGVYEQASHIVKAGLANPALAHEVQGNLNAMGVQAAQLGASFNNALLPVANEIVPRMTERMGKMTQLIKDNKDLILSLGRDFAEVWGNVEDTIEKVGEGLSVMSELARKNRVVRQTDSKTVIERYKDDASVKSAKNLVEREIANGGYSDEEKELIRLINGSYRRRQDLYLKEVKRANPEYQEIFKLRSKEFAEANKSILEKYKGDKSIKEATDLFNELTDAEKEAIAAQPSEFFESLIEKVAALNLELQQLRKEAQATAKEIKSVSEIVNAGGQALFGNTEQQERAKKYSDEAADIRAKTNLGDYYYQRYDINRRAQEQLSQKGISVAEYRAVLEKQAAELAQLEQNRADKVAEIERSITAELQLSFEQRQSLIEQEAQKQIEAGEAAAAAYSQAQDKINSKFKTSLDERIAGYKRDMDEWVKNGMDRAEAEELTQQRIDKAHQDYADKIQQHYKNANDTLFNATHSAYERELRDIERLVEEAHKRGETEEEISAMVAEAAAKEAAAIENEVDRIKKVNQSLEDEIYAQEHSQYEVDVRKLKQKVVELAKNGAPPENIERYYKNAFRELNAKAAKGGDYTKSPLGGSDIQIIDFGQQRQSDIGLFTNENTARQKVINSLTAEQRQLLEQLGVLDKVIAAQNSLVNSTEQAADSIQDAGKIEIIHGDEIEGGNLSTPEMPSLDDLLAGVIPTSELRELQTQTQEVTNAQGNLTDATDNVTSAEKNLSDATKDATTAQKNFAETTEQVKTALKNFAEDAGKLRGSKPEDTDVPLKMPTKSAPTDSESKPEKVNLQVKPQDTSYKLEDLGFDLDVFSAFEGVLGSAAGALVAAGVGGLTAASLPALIAAGIGIAGLAAVVSGTSDNRDERLNAPENLSPDAGEIANIDLSEITSPLAGIESNVQGIRDILQGKNAVDDAKAEALPDTSTETAPDLLTPLTNISDTVQNILGELQNRQDEDESANAISELQSKVSTQLSEVATQMSEGASQVSESITSPIESLSQALSEIQTQNAEQGTAESEGATYLENVASTVQSIWDDMQAAKETETAETTDTDDTATKLANIDTNVAAIWQKMSEETATETPTDTPQDSELSRLATIDEKVQSILTTLQDKAATEETPLGTLLEPLKQLDSPLSSIANAITEKEIELPIDTLVKPLDTISGFVSKIADMLSNREPPKVEISPNMDIDLGGAYVFDNEMKQSLVDDITNNIVSRITETVERATSQVSNSSYSS